MLNCNTDGHIKTVDHAEWSDLEVPDVYFSRAYHIMDLDSEPGAVGAHLLRWKLGDGVVYLPLIVRAITSSKSKLYDATSAYGYGGPWTEGSPPLSKFRTALDRWADSQGIVATFIRFHPLLGNAETFANALAPIEVGPTAVWDTSRERDLVAGMSKDHRKSWRRAQRAGVTAHVVENPRDLTSFREIYNESMRRLRANRYYYFPDQYWRALELSQTVRTIQVDALYNNLRVASLLALNSPPYLHIHLSGTTELGRQLGAAHVCRVTAALWAQQTGIHIVHSGGGYGGEQSTLLRWKQKFDAERPLASFSVAKLVHSTTHYQQLTGQTRWTTNGYFPPWRN